ncbi:MAG TPA: hypothetical protein VLX68_06065 [Chitinivibrionales bacterium]|nr:hypothetical protein [Chitinivibrionales bacterium]
MEKFKFVCLVCLAMLLAGCAGGKKLQVPLAEIDRPIVNPKGTWEIIPNTSIYMSAQDTVTYRGITYQGLVVPPVEYSITNNILVQLNPLGYLKVIGQLTKSPLLDTTKRYDWQFALDLTLYYPSEWERFGIEYKKRLSPSVWNSGYLDCSTSYHSREGWTFLSGIVGDGFGFQLSEKADVTLGLGLSYETEFKPQFAVYYGGDGNLNFHYSFSPWFRINVGTAIEFYKEKGSELSTAGSLEFMW